MLLEVNVTEVISEGDGLHSTASAALQEVPVVQPGTAPAVSGTLSLLHPSLNTPGTQQLGRPPFVFLWGGQRWYRMGYLSAHHWSLPGPSFAFLCHMQLLERQGVV